MIELIFAIVIIGVTVLTVPMMIETNNRGLEGNLAQEAIFLVSSVLSETTTRVWDDRSVVETGNPDDYVLSKILDVGAIGSAYGRTAMDSNIRVGGLRQDRHRQFFDYNGSLIAPAQTGDEALDVGLDTPTADIAGYKHVYSVSATRGYVTDTGTVFSDTTVGTPTNVKMTEVTISTNGEVVVLLRAYTANIGEIDYARRSF